MAFAAIAACLLGAKDGKFNFQIRWTEAEFVRLEPFAELQDVPYALLIALRKAENGKASQSYGQISINWEIRKLFDEDLWQMAQGARTLRRAATDFVLSNPQYVVEYNGRNKTWSVRHFLWTYRTKFVDELAVKYWAPEENREQWTRNVNILWRTEHAKRT